MGSIHDANRLRYRYLSSIPRAIGERMAGPMAVNVPNPGAYLGQLGQHLVDLQTAINNLVKDGTYLNAMGGASFLEVAPFNLSQADANLIESTIGAVTATNPTVQAINGFLASAITLTGGQTN